MSSVLSSGCLKAENTQRLQRSPRRVSRLRSRPTRSSRSATFLVVKSDQKPEELPLAAEPARRDAQRGPYFPIGFHLTEKPLIGPGKKPT